jgi:hypothetical protein
VQQAFFNRIIPHAFVFGALDMLLNRAAVAASVAVA